MRGRVVLVPPEPIVAGDGTGVAGELRTAEARVNDGAGDPVPEPVWLAGGGFPAAATFPSSICGVGVGAEAGAGAVVAVTGPACPVNASHKVPLKAFSFAGALTGALAGAVAVSGTKLRLTESIIKHFLLPVS